MQERDAIFLFFSSKDRLLKLFVWFYKSRRYYKESFTGVHRKESIDKAVNIAVHNSIYISVFKAGTRILSQCVGHEYIRADLTSPLNFHLNALDIRNLLSVLLSLQLH